MNRSEEYKNLRRLPVIRRARDYHLYDASGRRFLDLYLDRGRAWLGHRPDGVSLQLKNTLSRGVFVPFPSSEEGKMLKAAAALCDFLNAGCRDIAYYSCRQDREDVPGRPSDILVRPEASFVLWRPGLPWPDKAEQVEILIPLPGLDAGRIIVSRDGELPPGDLPSPVNAAAINRSLWSLLAALKEITAPLFTPGEEWTMQGNYCFFTGSADDYDRIFKKALEEGVLLSPSRESPCIIPRELSSGDLKVLKKVFPGGTAP